MEVIKEVLSVVFVLDEKKYGKLDGWDKLSGVMKEKYKECEKMCIGVLRDEEEELYIVNEEEVWEFVCGKVDNKELLKSLEVGFEWLFKCLEESLIIGGDEEIECNIGVWKVGKLIGVSLYEKYKMEIEDDEMKEIFVKNYVDLD